MGKPALLMADLNCPVGQYKDKQTGENRTGKITIGHLKLSQPDEGSGKVPRLFMELDTLFLAPGLVLLLAAADKENDLDKYQYASVFERGDRDPVDLTYRVCFPVRNYKDENGKDGTEWKCVMRIFKSPKNGRHYAKMDSLALNPTVIVQLRKAKQQIGDTVFLNLWMESKEIGSVPDVPAGQNDDDEIPF